jgi:hypothetical protein
MHLRSLGMHAESQLEVAENKGEGEINAISNTNSGTQESLVPPRTASVVRLRFSRREMSFNIRSASKVLTLRKATLPFGRTAAMGERAGKVGPDCI